MGTTLEDGTVVSRDSQHSTYEVATPTPEEEAYPPNGPGVVQTLSAPAATAPTMKTAAAVKKEPAA